MHILPAFSRRNKLVVLSSLPQHAVNYAALHTVLYTVDYKLKWNSVFNALDRNPQSGGTETMPPAGYFQLKKYFKYQLLLSLLCTALEAIFTQNS